MFGLGRLSHRWKQRANHKTSQNKPYQTAAHFPDGACGWRRSANDSKCQNGSPNEQRKQGELAHAPILPAPENAPPVFDKGVRNQEPIPT
jgi:hypothetical protein